MSSPITDWFADILKNETEAGRLRFQTPDRDPDLALFAGTYQPDPNTPAAVVYLLMRSGTKRGHTIRCMPEEDAVPLARAILAHYGHEETE